MAIEDPVSDNYSRMDGQSVGQLTVDKILFGPDYVPNAAIPETCPGGQGWSEKLREWLMEEQEF